MSGYQNGFFNNPDNMDQNGRSTVKSSDEIQLEIEEMNKKIKRLGEIWESDSSTALQNSHAAIEKDLKGFADMFGDLGKAISNGAKDIAEAEGRRASKNDYYQG